MRKIAGIIGIFIFVGVYLLFSQDKPQVDGPRIEFGENKFNFGEVGQDKVLKHVFVFRNTGTDTLRIYRVESS